MMGIVPGAQIQAPDKSKGSSSFSFSDMAVAVDAIRRFIVQFVRSWAGMLVITGVAVPIGATLITIGLYLSGSAASFSLAIAPSVSTPPVLVVLSSLTSGMWLACELWLLASLLLCRLATARGANSRSYYLLINRLYRLAALLGINAHKQPDLMSDEEMLRAVGLDAKTDKIKALREAHHAYIAVWIRIYQRHTGLSWVTGTAYINVWNMLHRAEEAMIEIVDKRSVVRGALHDRAAIKGSKIVQKSDLLKKLDHAVQDLDPEAMVYFNDDQTNSDCEDRLALLERASMEQRAALRKLGLAAGLSKQIDAETKISFDEVKATPVQRENALLALREVRNTLNQFRDHQWEGIMRTRNNLLIGIMLIGLVTYAILFTALLAADRQHILAAVAFYIVGALAGLFSRLNNEGSGNTTIDDYNLSFTRIIVDPLISGLAGVGGVVVTALLSATLTSGTSGGLISLSTVTLESIFQLNNPYLLVTAAAFGLAPIAIIQSLQQRIDQYTASLQSSKAATVQESGAKP